ncbi:hypothetical protein [Streptomyces tropicalis]|uniref:Secreted protein n=1 Tax=Streptomyces tropicalis TaxID=3034234 RepID=A0ABT6ABM0_9ACTN|nr:hypothetical protein [Streptomyces tropicalis]MDF3302048.1 hypothetical protein [Streptomyces tropicalis]
MASFPRSAVVGLAALTMSALGAAPAEASGPVTGYTDPAFGAQCAFHRFGEGETPPLSLMEADPLCVEYAKRDITVSNGGALRFLLAEPARFAVAVPACRYWQLDHWSVQVRPHGTELVGWNGSYWFDKSTGTAAARLRNLTVAGQPATPAHAARVLRPYDARLADAVEHATLGTKVQLPAGLPCTAARP